MPQSEQRWRMHMLQSMCMPGIKLPADVVAAPLGVGGVATLCVRKAVAGAHQSIRSSSVHVVPAWPAGALSSVPQFTFIGSPDNVEPSTAQLAPLL
mmetsp:Transcript_4865/g.15067  ORF Transcript_4865/g.15067 Transcript_4865/m.15067 type:complete len:96 (+) Transcript_4865:339-626(+)